jgi:hypothetical protein
MRPVGAAFGFLIFAAGCASQPASPGVQTAHADSPIATIHTQRCARCHALPVPGALPRDRLEAAFSRHRKRVQLAEDDWQAMMDYLASSR